MTTTKPPRGLSASSKRLWRAVLDEYELTPGDLQTFTCTLEALDDYLSAHRVLKRKGRTYKNRFGEPRPRPEIAIARDSRLAFFRGMRELGLDAVPAKEEFPRPKSLRGLAGGRA